VRSEKKRAAMRRSSPDEAIDDPLERQKAILDAKTKAREKELQSMYNERHLAKKKGDCNTALNLKKEAESALYALKCLLKYDAPTDKSWLLLIDQRQKAWEEYLYKKRLYLCNLHNPDDVDGLTPTTAELDVMVRCDLPEWLNSNRYLTGVGGGKKRMMTDAVIAHYEKQVASRWEWERMENV